MHCKVVWELAKAKQYKAGSSKLIYVDIKLNGRTTYTMVDIIATHNFIINHKARRLKLNLEKNPSQMKAMNSEYK